MNFSLKTVAGLAAGVVLIAASLPAAAQSTQTGLFLDLLSNPNQNYRIMAADALLREPPNDFRAAWPSLLNALRDKEAKVRRPIAELIWLGASSNRATRELVAKAFSPVLDRVSDPDPDVRMHAIQLIGLIGSAKPTQTTEALIGSATDQDKRVRTAALRALGEHGQKLPVVTSTLQQSLQTEADADARGAAALALGRIDAGATTVAALVSALDDPSVVVKIQSAQALGLIGAPAASAQAKLQAIAGDPATPSELKAAAEQSLAAIGASR